jgi:hypothetical protein
MEADILKIVRILKYSRKVTRLTAFAVLNSLDRTLYNTPKRSEFVLDDDLNSITREIFRDC